MVPWRLDSTDSCLITLLSSLYHRVNTFRIIIRQNNTISSGPNIPRCHYQSNHKQKLQKKAHDIHTTAPDLQIGDTVYFRDYSSHTASQWSAGKIIEKTSPLSYKIQFNGQTLRDMLIKLLDIHQNNKAVNMLNTMIAWIVHHLQWYH